jgi:hypothetical protein
MVVSDAGSPSTSRMLARIPSPPSAASDSGSPSPPSRTGRHLTSSPSPSYSGGSRFAGATGHLVPQLAEEEGAPTRGPIPRGRLQPLTAQTWRYPRCRLRWHTTRRSRAPWCPPRRSRSLSLDWFGSRHSAPRGRWRAPFPCSQWGLLCIGTLWDADNYFGSMQQRTTNSALGPRVWVCRLRRRHKAKTHRQLR